MTCLHDGSAFGGLLNCTLDSEFFYPGESRNITVTVLLTGTLTEPHNVINSVSASALSGDETTIAWVQTYTWVSWCQAMLNDTPMGNDLQAVIDASTQTTDVIKVTDNCRVHDLKLNKALTLQGGWNHDFSAWDPDIYTTTLDGQNQGRVIWVEGVVAPVIEEFTITGGNAGDYGGGVYINNASPTIRNNTITGNWAHEGGGLYNQIGSPIIANNNFTGNSADYGGGLYNEAGSPTIQENAFTGNGARKNGGGLHNISGSPTLQANVFTGNNGFNGGGLYIASGDPLIQNNRFTNNTVVNKGGGLYNGTGSPMIQNNTFIGNTATYGDGGGLYNEPGSPTIQNNTFIGNSADLYGGGVANDTGKGIFRSNIVVNNTALAGGGVRSYNGLLTSDYNAMWNNTRGDYEGVIPGEHDIFVDPLLVDPVNGDFHLAPGSPCIDAGDPVNYPPTDFEGDLRPNGPAPDIGADEFNPIGVVETIIVWLILYINPGGVRW
jgi:hypothetical protein